MSRAASAVERLAVLVFGVLLLAVGAGAVAWYADVIPGAPDQLDVSVVLEWTQAGWWPYAVGGAGIVLIVVGLSWLAAHTRRRTLSRIRLRGSGDDGRLTVDSSALVDAASSVLTEAPGVKVRRGRVIRERGELAIEVRASVDPGADLDEVADAVRRVGAVLGTRLGGDSDARCRVVLTGGGSRSKVSRVR